MLPPYALAGAPQPFPPGPFAFAGAPSAPAAPVSAPRDRSKDKKPTKVGVACRGLGVGLPWFWGERKGGS